MIIVAGGSVPLDLLGMAPLELIIFEQKNRSGTPFHYESMESLRFELRLRAAIVDSSVSMQKSEVTFRSFKKSYCNEAYWTRNENGGFQQKPFVRPSDAVRDIYVNGHLYGFECATAVIIVLYKAVLETIGTGAFDRLFANLYLYSWRHDSDLRLITTYGEQDSFPGDILYFKNPDVDPEMMEWQGENAIKLQTDLYFGHGIGIKNAEGIITKLNRHRKPGSTESAYLLPEATYPNFFYLEQAAFLRDTESAAALSLGPSTGAAGRIVARIGWRTGIYAVTFFSSEDCCQDGG
ncbi:MULTISPECIES: protein-glutamine gamma-glutamyltransferase [unclassified Paenibacillus]|uniref:protein-glutamine gamma-glutamyltransferase n=1 Tax=unclassified Paenibacillus TaxID=185978 RepID=UPI001AE2DBF4|nr:MULTISPECIES: protein-glutamine gamma-glutamyltransferase [unclassified Paenibacillus]MBP1157598.1 protein-glutamine gamma-glutamyltransferase [Paenibacillus sp. PvP091]MBP1171665.1 protein-glutamine gamma-glutamyltransferase [Paenibacillus sp. PvR098]MBP2438046.1 protein-glutamine gamma-glutamyltransferase [Paenibacillus sp. PvP052]